jgi:hypothetical protein
MDAAPRRTQDSPTMIGNGVARSIWRAAATVVALLGGTCPWGDSKAADQMRRPIHLHCEYTVRYAEPARAQAAYSNFVLDLERKSLTDTEGDEFRIDVFTDAVVAARWQDMTFRISRTDLRITVRDDGANGSGEGQCRQVERH